MVPMFRLLLFFATSLANPTLHRLSTSQNSLIQRRDYFTCEEQYGIGSINCGDDSFHFCYNPSLGESCCPVDHGYCLSGEICAPVAGFCCFDGEDPEVCAERLEFDIPPTEAVSQSPPSTSSDFIYAAITAPFIPLATITESLRISTATVTATEYFTPTTDFPIIGHPTTTTTFTIPESNTIGSFTGPSKNTINSFSQFIDSLTRSASMSRSAMWPDHTAPVGFAGRKNFTSPRNTTDFGKTSWDGFGYGIGNGDGNTNGNRGQAVVPLEFTGDAVSQRKTELMISILAFGVIGMAAFL